tara:strand:+ start:457 stop:672 length:216 start_codon:yes stop_codon:yes gene_type:complete
MTREQPPEGWTSCAAYVGWEATHRDFDASYEGPEDGWVGNGLSAWGKTEADVLAEIAEIEATHPHFEERAA